MTISSLLELARRIHATGDTALVGSECRDLAAGILDLLAEAQPCGWEDPIVRNTTEYGYAVVIPEQWAGVIEPTDARHMARMLLRAADSAEGDGEK